MNTLRSRKIFSLPNIDSGANLRTKARSRNKQTHSNEQPKLIAKKECFCYKNSANYCTEAMLLIQDEN